MRRRPTSVHLEFLKSRQISTAGVRFFGGFFHSTSKAACTSHNPQRSFVDLVSLNSASGQQVNGQHLENKPQSCGSWREMTGRLGGVTKRTRRYERVALVFGTEINKRERFCL